MSIEPEHRARTRAVAVALVLVACTAGTPTPAPDVPEVAPTEVDVDVDVERDPSFQLMLLWHQHQPFYPKDDEGVVTRPWVRVHATKDYVDTATLLEQYPDVHATINLTPVLMLQLEELQAGVRDSYWVHSEIPADDLDDDEKRFLLTRLFDVNARVIDRFPRYRELADRRTEAGGGEANLGVFTTAEYRDLQVLFNLAWTDPDFLTVAPLAALVAKGRDFTEEDKAVLLAEHERIVGEVFEVHRRMWDAGQIEVITTPLAHPILPLVIDTSVALVGDPTAVMPDGRFNEPDDAVEQVERGLDVAERLLGRRPVGMWPGEGAVSQPAAAVMSRAGIQWIATGEPVLAASLGRGSGFARGENGVPDDAELLYRPWSATFGRNPDLPIFFRDLRLSDLVGFEYSGMSGEDAAQDFMDRLAAIKAALGPADPGQPWVVSVVLDGENAWEQDDDDGKDFFHALYSKLSGADWLTTTTPSAYLAAHDPPQALPGEVFPSSWFQANYATWIGEDEEAAAWDYLIEARTDLTAAGTTGAYTDAQLAAAREAILFAEGSDWFWWYGADRWSGDDGYFDTAFRAWLARMYRALGQEVPGYVDVPIVASAPSEPSATSSEVITPVIDGVQSEGEWAAATVYGFTDATPSLVALGFDTASLHLLIDGFGHPITIELGVPSGMATRGRTIDGAPVGFGVTHQLQVSDDQACLRPATEDGSPDLTCSPAAWNSGLWEASIPVTDIGFPGGRATGSCSG